MEETNTKDTANTQPQTEANPAVGQLDKTNLPKLEDDSGKQVDPSERANTPAAADSSAAEPTQTASQDTKEVAGDEKPTTEESQDKAEGKEDNKKPLDIQKLLNLVLGATFVLVNIGVITLISYLFFYKSTADSSVSPENFPVVNTDQYEIAKQTFIDREQREIVNGEAFQDPFRLDNQAPQPGNEGF